MLTAGDSIDSTASAAQLPARTTVKRTGQQLRLDAGQGTDLDDDPLDGLRASIGSDFNDLCQQGLANGQLVQSVPIQVGDPQPTVASHRRPGLCGSAQTRPAGQCCDRSKRNEVECDVTARTRAEGISPGR